MHTSHTHAHAPATQYIHSNCGGDSGCSGQSGDSGVWTQSQKRRLRPGLSLARRPPLTAEEPRGFFPPPQWAMFFPPSGLSGRSFRFQGTVKVERANSFATIQTVSVSASSLYLHRSPEVIRPALYRSCFSLLQLLSPVNFQFVHTFHPISAS